MMGLLIRRRDDPPLLGKYYISSPPYFDSDLAPLPPRLLGAKCLTLIG